MGLVFLSEYSHLIHNFVKLNSCFSSLCIVTFSYKSAPRVVDIGISNHRK